VALAGYMQRDLVEERRWISKEEDLEGLAAQLAIYLCGVRGGGVLGGTLAVVFALPSFVVVVVLAPLYLRFEVEESVGHPPSPRSRGACDIRPAQRKRISMRPRRCLCLRLNFPRRSRTRTSMAGNTTQTSTCP
jgi:hypothetical protein